MRATLMHNSYWPARQALRAARWNTVGWGRKRAPKGTAGEEQGRRQAGIGRKIDGKILLEGRKDSE